MSSTIHVERRRTSEVGKHRLKGRHVSTVSARTWPGCNWLHRAPQAEASLQPKIAALSRLIATPPTTSKSTIQVHYFEATRAYTPTRPTTSSSDNERQPSSPSPPTPHRPIPIPPPPSPSPWHIYEMAMLHENNSSDSSSNHHARSSNESSKRSNTQASAYAVNASTMALTGFHFSTCGAGGQGW